MKEFIKRLSKSVCDCGMVVLVGILMLLMVSAIFGVIIVLPMWLLTFVIGDYGYYWIFVSLIGMIIFSEWEGISKWFKWQFVEPFKK